MIRTPFRSTLLSCLAVMILMTSLANAQSGLRISFSTDGTEAASSGFGGTSLTPGNTTAVFRDEALLLVQPTMSSNPPAAFLADRATWAAWFGDDDADGLYNEGVVGNLDAIQVAPNAANPPSLFDYFLSFSDDVGPLGFLGPPLIKDGDIVQLLPQGGYRIFLSEVQAATAMSLTPTSLDLNGFSIDANTGDLYWTMTTSQTVNGVILDDGGVVRLAASGYTTNPDGTVATVSLGAAQIVLHEANVDLMYILSTGGLVGDLDGITMDPAGGTFVGPTGVTLPHMWFAADSTSAGTVIVSTQSGGTLATHLGVTLNGPGPLGLASTDWAGGPNSTVSALDVTVGAQASPPPVINALSIGFATPSNLKIDFGQCAPGTPFYLLGKLGQTSTFGGFTSRTPVLPQYPSIGGPGSFPALFLNNFSDPLFLLSFNLPPATADSQGGGSFIFPLPLITPGNGIALQGIDASRFAITPPLIIPFL